MRPIHLFLLSTFALPALGQTMNVSAVDTLTKRVALAVFENIVRGGNQPKAQAVYDALLLCEDDCNPQEVIRSVGGGSWDQVGQKMQELAKLGTTEQFRKASAAEANAAIRRQLAQFYSQHKAEKPYSVPLSPGVQATILARIDEMLPPAEPTPETTAQPGTAPQPDAVVGDDENPVSSSGIAISQLERAVKDEQDKNLWTMLLSGLIGLLVGAGAVYLLAYRSLKNEVDRLVNTNNRLSGENDFLRQQTTKDPRPRNYASQQPTQPAPEPPYQPVETSLPTPAPVVAVPAFETPQAEPVVPPAPEQPAAPEPPRDTVLYFPPPSPDGLFDGAQQTDRLTPESAYRFDVRSQTPDQAQFRFEAEPSRVARFLTYRNYMIEPACDSENSYSAQHTRIVSIRAGAATRENGGWRVTKKALVRYE